MKDLQQYIKESLLDMDDDIVDDVVKKQGLLELFKEYLQYTDKTNNNFCSATLIFHKKYGHKQFEKIAREFGNKLSEMGIDGNPESGVFEQGSLKVYYNDYEFKLDKMGINVDFSYTYQKAIIRKNYMDVESEIPDHGLMQISVSGKPGRDFLRTLKKELLVK
jgi:hypothetical protein